MNEDDTDEYEDVFQVFNWIWRWFVTQVSVYLYSELLNDLDSAMLVFVSGKQKS